MDFVGHSREQVAQEFDRDHAGHALVQLGESELGGTVNRHKQVQLAFFGLDLGNVKVKIADGIRFEPAFLRLLGDLWQAADAVLSSTQFIKTSV